MIAERCLETLGIAAQREAVVTAPPPLGFGFGTATATERSRLH
jgi:hypothetical protein